MKKALITILTFGILFGILAFIFTGFDGLFVFLGGFLAVWLIGSAMHRKV